MRINSTQYFMQGRENLIIAYFILKTNSCYSSSTSDICLDKISYYGYRNRLITKTNFSKSSHLAQKTYIHIFSSKIYLERPEWSGGISMGHVISVRPLTNNWSTPRMSVDRDLPDTMSQTRSSAHPLACVPHPTHHMTNFPVSKDPPPTWSLTFYPVKYILVKISVYFATFA